MQSEIESSFQRLNEKITSYFQNNDESLREAKELFTSYVGSNRQLENVSNIEQLLALLKRRGLYNPTDFNTFWIFKKIIDDENFVNLVTRHGELIKSHRDVEESPQNVYSRIRLDQQQNQRVPLYRSNDEPIPNTECVRNEIFNIISNGISVGDFRRLARHLDFSSAEIKDFEVRNNDYRTQNLVLLRHYESRKGSLTRLLKVLQLIEKHDLVNEIIEILKRNQ